MTMLKKSLRMFPIIILIMLVLTLGACAGEEEEAVEKLTVGIWGGFWGDAYKAAAIDRFVEETGIQVDMVTNVEDSIALYATEVEKDVPLYDVLWLTDGEYRIAVNSDLLAEIDYANIEHADDIYEAGKGDYGISSEIGAWGLAYNEDLLDFVPTSWADLLNPDIAPLVGFVEPDFSGGSMFNLTILAEAAGGTAEDTATLGIEQGKLLAENGAQFGNFGEILTLFSNGDIALATLYHQEPIFFGMDGMPAGFVMPEEGAYPVTAWMTMPRNIPDNRKAAAEQFMTYVLSPEAQEAIAEEIFSAPINSSVELSPELAAQVHPNSPAEADTMVKPDWEYTIENLEDWIDLWNREVQP